MFVFYRADKMLASLKISLWIPVTCTHQIEHFPVHSFGLGGRLKFYFRPIVMFKFTDITIKKILQS